MKGIILHGGHGTRLRPLTQTMPKQLLPIANKPMSQYALETIRNAGIKEIAIILGDTQPEKVKEHYGNGDKFGVNITYVYQEEPRGISHAIGLCRAFVGSEKFIVFLGDNILLKDISEYVLHFSKSNDAAKILLCKVSNPSQFGIADLTSDGKIKKIIEKPKSPPTDLAVIGIYFLSPIIFDIIAKLKPSWRNELEITDALQLLLESNHTISYDIVTNYWRDAGTVADIIDANNTVLSYMTSYIHGQKNSHAVIRGKVMVGHNTRIDDNTSIDGPVIIGENCIINGTSHIGPNTSIGNNSKIKDCSIDNSIIMNNCTIDGKISLSNSIISHNSIVTSSHDKKTVLVIGESSKIIL